MDFGDDALFPASEWKYLVLTYDSANARFKAYVNGELESEEVYEAAFPAEFTSGHLGAGNNVNSFYSGLIDEFAVYPHILSEPRILAHWATVDGPIITPQPQDAAIFAGNTATFNAGVITGFDDVPQFRWQRNGVDIPGATNASYTTPVLTADDNGVEYRAMITSGSSAFVTRTATVSVTSLPPFGYRDAVLADSPVVYYRFEETEGVEALDSSVSGVNGEYDGVILGQASFNAVLGRAGRFDESSVSVPSLGTLAAFTIEAWIKPDGYEEFNAIFDTEEWMPGSVHFQLIDDEKIALSLNAGPDANDEDQEEDAEFGGSEFLAAGEWRHVVATYDSADSKSTFYVNGVPAGANTFSIPPVAANFESSHIGAWNGDERFFFGLIDEFAIYDKVLAPARVLEHYQAAAGTSIARPRLDAVRIGNQLQLTWTGSGFVLEGSTDLANSTWSPMDGASANSATVSTTSGTQYFRLRKP